MSYQTPTALLMSEIDQAIYDGGHLNMTQWVEESYDHCVSTLASINEIALQCNFDEINRGAQKLAMINQTLAEMAQALSLMNQTRHDLLDRKATSLPPEAINSQLGGEFNG